MARGGGTARPRRRRRLSLVDPNAQAALPERVADERGESVLLEQRARQRLGVANLGRAALQGSDAEELGRQAISLAVDTLGAERAVILELDPQDQALVVTAAGGAIGPSIMSARVLPEPSTSFLRAALSAPEPLLVDEWTSEPRFDLDELFRSDDVRSGCATPIRSPAGSVGVIAILSRQPAAFTPDDCNYVRTIANVLGAAWARQRAEDELRASEALIRDALRSERQTRLELEENIARLDTLLQHAPVAFGFFDRDLRFVRLNDRLASLSGLPMGEHLGRRITDVLPDLWRELEAPFHAVLEEGQNTAEVEVSAQLAGAPGLERHFAVSCYPVRVQQEVLGLGALVVDVTQRRRAELAASLIGKASELLASKDDLAAALDEAVSIPIPAFADSCQIFLFSTEDRPWYAATAHGDHRVDRLTPTDDAKYAVDPNTPGAIKDAVSTGRAQLVARIGAEQTRTFAQDDEHRRIIEQRGLNSAIVAPLLARGEVLGLLFLTFSGASGRRYRPDDLDLAEELATRFALVVDARRLEVEARRASERLDLLARAGALMVVELDTGERMEQFTNLPVPVFADVCALHLLDRRGKFRLEALAARDERLREVFARPESWAPFPTNAPTPNADACRTRRAVLISDLPAMVRDRMGAAQGDTTRALGLGSLLCAPLVGLDGDAIGTLTFIYDPTGRRYGDVDIPVAEELGRRAAAFFQHSLRFEQEQATVEVLQRSLVPARLPEIPGIDVVTRYRPGGVSQRVGGDWFDVVASHNGTVLVAVGDVVGHGLAAAWSTGQLRAGVHLAAIDGLGPAETLDRLNRLLLNVADAEMGTVALLEYDPTARTLRLATAGHPPPVVMTSTGERELFEGAVGFPLRASTAARYDESTRPFGRGDLTMMYTDGLVERRGESLDVGLERLRAALEGAPDDLEELADHVLERMLPAGGAEDDVALVIMRAVADATPLYLEVPARPEELAGARAALRSWLGAAGVEPDASRDIVIAANEALANAIEHGSPSEDAIVSLTAQRATGGGAAVIAVRDRGRWLDREPRPGRGRGLDLMRAIMDVVDIDAGSNGTTVTLHRALVDGSGDRATDPVSE